MTRDTYRVALLVAAVVVGVSAGTTAGWAIAVIATTVLTRGTLGGWKP